MKILKYITAVFALLFVIASCEKEVTNPVLEDTDYRVYFYGSGENAYNVAREGFDVMLGESLEVKLMNSPSESTQIKWVLASDSSLINETLNYTFAPEAEGLQKTWFVSTLSSGTTDTVTFNFRGVTDGIVRDAKSEMAVWQNFEYPQGIINGSFTAEFDMVAEKNNTNCITGFQSGEAGGFGDLSAIVRFTTAGNFDARNGGSYTFDNEVKYSAGLNYHFRMEVDALNMKYDVFITDADGLETQLADDFAFRKQVSDLSHWSVIADAWQTAPENQGYHTVANMEITNVLQNVRPIFSGVYDTVIDEGSTDDITVRAKDPLGGVAIITAENLPRFAKLVDNGNGSATITYSPYDNCGGCDVGNHTFKLIATNAEGSTEQAVNVKVNAVSNLIEVIADAGDGTVWTNGTIDNVYTNLFGGRIDVGAPGGNSDVVSVMPFVLPSIPADKKIKSAYLKVSVLVNNSWVAVDYDVYAKTARETSEVLPTDFYVGDFDGDSESIAVQQGMIQNGNPVNPNPANPPTNPSVEVSTSDDASLILASFINDQYSQGSEGKFIFMRIGSNRNDMPTWAHLQIKSADTDVDGTQPVLVLTLEDK